MTDIKTVALGERIQALLVAISQRSASDSLRLLVASGLTMPQLVALPVLVQHGDHTVSGLAERLKLSRAATSHLVERLVGLGHVRRTEDEKDRRQKHVAITTGGRKLVTRLAQARVGEVGKALERISPESRARLAAAIDAVIAELGGIT